MVGTRKQRTNTGRTNSRGGTPRSGEQRPVSRGSARPASSRSKPRTPRPPSSQNTKVPSVKKTKAAWDNIILPPGVRIAEGEYKCSTFTRRSQESTFNTNWTLDDIKSKVRERIAQHTKSDTDQFRQISKIFAGGRDLTPDEMHDMLRDKFRVDLTQEQVKKLVIDVDVDKSGTVDLYEFTNGLVPAYNPELSLPTAPVYGKPEHHVEMQPLWNLDQVERRLQQKIEQRTGDKADYFRSAFQMFANKKKITAPEFHSRVHDCFGINLTKDQLLGLFTRYDKDDSGDLDVQEFVSGVMPSDAPHFHKNNLKHPSETAGFKQLKMEVKYTGQDAFHDIFAAVADKNGLMDLEGLQRGLRQLQCDIPLKDVHALFKVYDQETAGHVNAELFAQSFVNASEAEPGTRLGHVDPRLHEMRIRTLVTPQTPDPCTPDVYKVSRTGRRRPSFDRRDRLFSPITQRPATDRLSATRRQIQADPWFKRTKCRSELLGKRRMANRNALVQLSARSAIAAPPSGKRHF